MITSASVVNKKQDSSFLMWDPDPLTSFKHIPDVMNDQHNICPIHWVVFPQQSNPFFGAMQSEDSK